MVYAHPWELDTARPVVEGVSLRHRCIRSYNIKSTRGKLERLLADFTFCPARELIPRE
jgi:hypothetical protein